MCTLETTIKNFKFNSYASVLDGLSTIDTAKENYPKILSAAKGLTATKFRFVTKSLLKINTDFVASNEIIVQARKKNDPEMRRNITLSFKESKRDIDFLTSISLMTPKDGGLFLRDYLDLGGQKKMVARWLVAAATLLMRQKREGLYDGDFDYSISGAIDAVGDGLSSLGGSLVECFNAVADSIIEAGEAIGDFVSEIATFTISQLTDLVETIIEAGRDIGELLDAMVDVADNVLKKLYQAVIFAMGSTMELIKSAVKNNIFIKCLKILNTLTGAVSLIVHGALELSATILKQTVTFLVQAGRKAANIIRLIAKTSMDGIAAALEAIKDLGYAIDTLVTSACRAMYKAGVELIACLSWILTEAAEAGAFAVNGLIRAGARIRDILTDAYKLSREALSECLGFLVDIGRSTWYLLSWAAYKSVEILSITFEKLIETGRNIGELVAWSIRRTGALMSKGFSVLLQLGYTVTEIIVAIITAPRNALKRSYAAIMDLGASVEDFVSATVNLGKEFFIRTMRIISDFGMGLLEILAYAVEVSKQFFMKTVRYLFDTMVSGFDILVWALNWSSKVFGWVLEVCTKVFDNFVIVFEWLIESTLGEKAKQWLADWLQTWVVDKIEWVKDKIILPLMAVGKLALFITVAALAAVLLCIAYIILKSLVDENKTDYLQWPDNFADFKAQMGNRLIELPPVTAQNKYVIISDVHKESQADIDGGIGHFYKNKALFKQVMANYGKDESWTVISNGDAEEFWLSSDMSPYGDGTDKVQPILNENRDVFDTLSSTFYKYKKPRKFVKLRGNHDDVWDENKAENKLSRSGFPNLDIREFATFRHQGKDVLVMHGHQFDKYNCDANNFLGKLITNYLVESLDEINEILVNMVGWRIEGNMLLPFPVRQEWEKWIRDIVTSPKLVDGATFNEKLLAEPIRKYDCSFVLGHTHDPKIVVDSQDNGRMYVNSGTCGWWEGAMWTVEYTEDGVALKIWTKDNPSVPYLTFCPNQAYDF